jgi:hypothetical protein
LIALGKSSLEWGTNIVIAVPCSINFKGFNMEIRIKRMTTADGYPDLPEDTGVYLVIDNGKEFTIACRIHIHGNSICLAGQKGTLHTETDTGKVYRQVVSPGGGCGLIINDEPVEGLSARALRGVIIAEQGKETGEIVLTAEDSERNPHEPPVMYIDGKAVDLDK